MMSFLSNSRSSHERLALRNRNFDNFSEVLEKICEGVCVLVKLQTVGHNHIKNEFLHRYAFKEFAKMLVTLLLSGIGRTPI